VADFMLKNNNGKCYSLTVVFKQNCESSAMCSVNNDAVPAEVDETQNHIQPVFVLETHHWAW